MSKYVVGVDVGTTGSKAMVLDLQGNIYGKGYREYALNYPNPDWVEVGANFLLGVTFEAVKEADAQMFICADHGNAEQLLDYETGAPFTAHTTNPVPFILVNADPAYTLREGGCLADIAPTLIELMGMEKPEEMTGKSLLVK